MEIRFNYDFTFPFTMQVFGHYVGEETTVDARLIAAAPTQNDALAAAVATIERDRLLWSGFPQQRKDDWELMLSEMKAALKKARGAQP